MPSTTRCRASAPKSCARRCWRAASPSDKVVAIGRGKREPMVPTAEGVAEARNRRVEIQVR